MDELLHQFILEARELVQAAIDNLLALEVEPDNSGRLDSVFRAVHTLKGSTGLFDLTPLHTVLHAAEDSLGRVRSGAANLDTSQIDAISAGLEWFDRCVDDLDAHGAVDPQRLQQASALEQALVGGAGHADEPEASDAAEWALSLAAQVGGSATVALRYRPHPECFFSGDDPLELIASIPQLTHLAVKHRDPWSTIDMFDPFRSNLHFEALSAAPIGDVEAIFRLVPDQVEILSLRRASEQPVELAPTEARADTARSLRVDPARIDTLLDLVGELITTKNSMSALGETAIALPGGAELARSIAAALKDLDRVSGALYGGVLQTRMVPLAQAFNRLPRMVRDLSRRLGKPTHLQIDGDTIEADKTIVDELFEPLLHLVRNAMDHGIEPAAERLTANKSAAARIELRVVREGDTISVSLSDDGRGIDPAIIRSTAMRKGLISTERAESLSDRNTFDLLFTPGFSTAAKVSDLSGRGVGLDAVRTDIARLGGTVGLDSRLGQGTIATLRLPISFAMTQLLVVSVCGERYGVPMQDVVETVRIRPEAITSIRANRAFVLRDHTVPLLALSDLLGLAKAPPAEEMIVLVLELVDQRVGIIIDEINERIETISRPPGGLLKGMLGMAGTTVLGSGEVLLVLDVAELVG
ncbi:chemotaxis protein CheA [Devosia sp. RR2S18]|uniref:chemotaxis protein CheA n=1 Tax=Devosia rhizosphaerae TaxID=3049774 RepID=UPI00254157A3|nr:chemotaxis protein CheA [Devosia sp. RR2S18]WIJ25840.1 chemotaxis protein CheA [Devosia sp. RR2S18]